METAFLNMDRLPPPVKTRMEPYLKELVPVLQDNDNLVSVFVYGPAAGPNYVPQKTPVTSVFVFKDLPFSCLQKSLKTVNKGIRKQIAAPLFITRHYLETSLDVFPVEFLEMQENYILLWGEDILGPLTIDQKHIRLFCEEQVKGKLIRIRQAYLEIGLHKKGIEALLKESLLALIPIFRNLIRLKGQTPPLDHEEIVSRTCALFDLHEKAFLPVLKDHENDERIGRQDVTVFLEYYLTELNKLASEVDRL